MNVVGNYSVLRERGQCSVYWVADPSIVNVLENVLSFQESPVDTKNENLISLNHFLTFSIRCFFSFRFVLLEKS